MLSLVIWISLRAQLQNEGVIHEQARSREASPAWWPSFADLFRKRAFAMAAVGALIVIAAASQFQKPRVQVLEPRDNGFDSTVSVLRQQEHDLRPRWPRSACAQLFPGGLVRGHVRREGRRLTSPSSVLVAIPEQIVKRLARITRRA